MVKINKTLIKVLLTLVAFYIIFSKIDLDNVKKIIVDVNSWQLFCAFIFFNLSKILSSIRLNMYFKHIGIHLTELYALRLYYIGMFYNLFLPSGIGGDGYKIYLLKKNYKIKVSSLFSATLLDRLSGLIPLMFFAGILFFNSEFYNRYMWLDWIMIINTAVIFPLFYLLNWFLFKKYISLFFKTTLVGSMVQILQLFSALFIIYAIGYENFITVFLTLFLLSSIMAILPISIGGVGIRELTFLYGLNLIGLNADSGIAFSFLFFLITALSSFIGIFLKSDII